MSPGPRCGIDGFRYHAAPMEIVTIPPKKA